MKVTAILRKRIKMTIIMMASYRGAISMVEPARWEQAGASPE